MGLLDDDEVMVTDAAEVAPDAVLPPRELSDEDFEKNIAEEIAQIEKERALLQAEIQADRDTLEIKKVQDKLKNNHG